MGNEPRGSAARVNLPRGPDQVAVRLLPARQRERRREHNLGGQRRLQAALSVAEGSFRFSLSRFAARLGPLFLFLAAHLLFFGIFSGDSVAQPFGRLLCGVGSFSSHPTDCIAPLR